MRRHATILFAGALAMVLAACGQTPAATPSEPAAPANTAAPAAAATAAPAGGGSAQPSSGGMIQKIISRGNLICGINNNSFPGFAEVDSSGNNSGFDVDFCRTIAAALFDDPTKVEFVPLSSQDRFTALQTGQVDVLIRNSTWTLTRDGDLGLDWAPTIFYDGQGMMVRNDSGITSLDDMGGATICVQTGTTTELNLADVFRAKGLEFTPLVFDDGDAVRNAYDSGQCDGYTTDKSGLVAEQTQLANPADHNILADTMSKEPLGPSVLQGDAQWADAVNWIVYATFQAEEFGITSQNIGDFAASEVPEIRRFLGIEGELGMGVGLEIDFAARVVTHVGNYEEIYNRSLGPDTQFDLPRGQNSLDRKSVV